MKLALLISFLMTAFNCKKNPNEKQPIAFNDHSVAVDWFHYLGKDAVYDSIKKSDSQYYNPILTGFYPDPSICRVGDDYYLITSSFAYFPGLPIFKSSDLINWKQIGHVLTRREQTNFDSAGVSRGLFAPTIRYHKGTFYVICTNVSSKGNFIVKTNDTAGEWSDPIWLSTIDGIDPDLFFDDDGRTYVTHNGPPPNNESLHDGHRAIYIWEYDLETQKTVSGPTLLVNGGTDMAKKPVWIEAPHIFKKDGYYYLICAEGGTGYQHSEVVFRSKDVLGPYESYDGNPILTQRHLDKTRSNQITTAGHADFVETPQGEWWGVFLGCRPYEMDYYNTGRETFLLPVKWDDNGWPIFVNGKEPLPFVHQKPNLASSGESHGLMAGNFEWRDDFEEGTLDFKWNFLRNPGDWFTLEGGFLCIKPTEESIHDHTNVSFLARRQQHLEFEASTKIIFNPKNFKEVMGLMAFQNEGHYLFLGTRMNPLGEKEVFVERAAFSGDETKPETVAAKSIEDGKELYLKMEGRIRYYDFYYKVSEPDEWILLAKDVDGINLSTKEAQGFVGTMLSIYASKNHFN